MVNLLSLREQDMVKLMADNGFQSFRGKQLFEWVWKKGIKNFDNMKNLPGNLKVWLKEHATVGTGKVANVIATQDGNTVKFLFKYPTEAGETVYIETVLMCYARDKSRNRNTVCVSAQAGCAMGCKFCASALEGLARNLSAGEIAEQVWYADNYLSKRGLPPVTNVVFMGMGEPFYNFTAVMASVAILHQGKNIGMRRMTISTAGVVPRIRELVQVNPQITLAVSLHAPNDVIRDRLMPINKRYPLAELMDAVDYYTSLTNRRVTMEYALFQGVNDSKAVGYELVELLKNRLVNVNILKGNPVPETGLLPVEDKTLQDFLALLNHGGIEASLRESRGKDIDGACGQLRKRSFSEKLPEKDDK